MPRYEFIEGASKKFWEISLEGSSFTTTYGRIGTEGQTSMKEYDSEEKAKKEYDKLIAEKTKKGYTLVDGATTAAAVEPAATAVTEAKPKKAKAEAKAAPEPKPKKAVFADEGDDEEEDQEEEEKPKPKKAAAKPEPKGEAKAAAPKASSSKSGDAGARYFEFIDGASSKFWEISLSGNSFTTRYGKIGTDGQMSMKEYDSDEKAKREYDKLVAEKTKKGYVEK